MRCLLATSIGFLGVLGAAEPSAARLLAFKSPSGNLTCVMSTSDGGFAQCEDRSRPFGGGVSVNRAGRMSRYDVGYDDLAQQRFVLRYGRSRRLEVFRCTSRKSGMTCSNTRKHRGFTIRRGRTKIF
jgi:hypothetical protein